jgi:hypothetical protein
MEQARPSIRWAELRVAAIAAVLYGIAVAVLMPGNWPLMPFPAVAPIEIAALLGFAFGFLTRRLWVVALPLTVLVALDPAQSGFAGAIIALLVLWPFTAAGGVLGVGAGRWLKRRMLRRLLRAARRPARVSPPPPAGAPVRASRGERVPVAGASARR